MILAFNIIFAYILFSIFHFWATIYVSKWMKKEKDNIKLPLDETNMPEIVIIIPALREVSLVEDTMDYFSKMKYSKDKYKIVFVTTVIETISKQNKRNKIEEFYKKISLKSSIEEIGECNEGLFPFSYLKEIEKIIRSGRTDSENIQLLYTLYDSVPTTNEAIKKAIERNKDKYGNYYIADCQISDMGAGKPTQLNYVIEHLSEIIGEFNEERLLIGVYDFDSRPDLRTLAYIAWKEKEDEKEGRKPVDFYQQTQLPYMNIKNIDVMSKSKSLMKANIIMYTRRALGIEIFKILRYKKHLKYGKFQCMSPIINCLGAGMFIEKKTLKEIGGFAEPVEDLVLGYQLNIRNKNVEPIPYINIMQPYLYIKEMINSHSRIFMIGLRLHREGKYIGLDKWKYIIPAIKEFIECIMWLVCCPIMWTAFIGYLMNGYITVGILLLFCVILLRFWMDFAMLTQETKRQISDYDGINCIIEMSRKQWIVMMLLTPILGIIRFISALVGVGKYIFFYVLHKKVYRKKTER